MMPFYVSQSVVNSRVTCTIKMLCLLLSLSLLLVSPLYAADNTTAERTNYSEETKVPDTSAATQVMININQADIDRLQTLKGIGPKKAQRIVDYRNQHGPFSSLEALTQVPGVSLGIIEQNRHLLTL